MFDWMKQYGKISWCCCLVSVSDGPANTTTKITHTHTNQQLSPSRYILSGDGLYFCNGNSEWVPQNLKVQSCQLKRCRRCGIGLWTVLRRQLEFSVPMCDNDTSATTTLAPKSRQSRGVGANWKSFFATMASRPKRRKKSGYG